MRLTIDGWLDPAAKCFCTWQDVSEFMLKFVDQLEELSQCAEGVLLEIEYNWYPRSMQKELATCIRKVAEVAFRNQLRASMRKSAHLANLPGRICREQKCGGRQGAFFSSSQA